jgi:hypothetical protein
MNEAQVAKRDQIADFLRRRVSFAQYVSDTRWEGSTGASSRCPTRSSLPATCWLTPSSDHFNWERGWTLDTTDGAVSR